MYKINNDVVSVFVAVTMGLGGGLIVCAAGQKIQNQYVLKTCPSKPGHQIVMLSSFVGDTYYCLDKNML